MGKNTEYVSPEVLVMEILVEKGFAGSGEDGMNTPDWGEI